ncbi:hypothetical protein BJ742DRAFT_807907 [Cladochytrium replicatum]|nr:hypothetical protein BJ742DRAFT_807907 [Cladochytrium replicatum]
MPFNYMQLAAACAVVIYHPMLPISSLVLYPMKIERVGVPFPGTVIYCWQYITIGLMSAMTCNRLLLFLQNSKIGRYAALGATVFHMCMSVTAAVSYVLFTIGVEDASVMWTAVGTATYAFGSIFEIVGVVVLLTNLNRHRKALGRTVPVSKVEKTYVQKKVQGSAETVSTASLDTGATRSVDVSTGSVAEPIAKVSLTSRLLVNKIVRYGKIDPASIPTRPNMVGERSTASLPIRTKNHDEGSPHVGLHHSIPLNMKAIRNLMKEFDGLLFTAKLLVGCVVLVDVCGVLSALCWMFPECGEDAAWATSVNIVSDGLIGLHFVFSLVFLRTATTCYSMKSPHIRTRNR